VRSCPRLWPDFHNITGLNDYDNYMNTNAPADFDYYAPCVAGSRSFDL
jgi:hypothetical protein